MLALLLAVSVLFVGNSYTGTNNMPAMFAAVAGSMKHPQKVDYDIDVLGGASLKYFYDNGSAQEELQSTHFDYMILQEQSNLEGDVAAFKKYASLLIQQAKNARTKPVLFLTWEHDAFNDQAALTQAYSDVAQQTGAIVAPAGIAFTDASRAGYKVYDQDGSHPAPLGSYVVACALAATIFQQSPEGATGDIADLIKLDPATALAVQKLAWNAVQTYATGHN